MLVDISGAYNCLLFLLVQLIGEMILRTWSKKKTENELKLGIKLSCVVFGLSENIHPYFIGNNSTFEKTSEIYYASILCNKKACRFHK